MRLPPVVAALNAAVLACAVLAAGTVGVQERPPLATTGRQDVQPAPEPTLQVDAAPAPAEPAVEPPAPPPAAAAAPAPEPQAVRTPSPPVPAQPPRVKRTTARTGWAPYAMVGPVTLHFPGDVVEVVGLHQSGHDGAQPQSPVTGPARIGRMDSRNRDTHEQGAADIVVEPTGEVRAPVTGTVLRAGTYTLYCDHVDDYVVVEPDARPGWEVKMLHFKGVTVQPGDRVQAGVTVVGMQARVLPFASQVDKHTVAPHWPHLHVEVVDTAIPDRPSGGRCR